VLLIHGVNVAGDYKYMYIYIHIHRYVYTVINP
jgi:hypothetical protein